MGDPYKRPGRKNYYLEFRDQHDRLRQHVNLYVTDKRIANQIAAEIQEDVERLKAGLPPKHADTIGSHLGLGQRGPGAVTWEEAVTDYLADLVRRGSAEHGRHWNDTRKELNRMARECKWTVLSDVTAATWTAYQDARASKSVRTRNKDRQTLDAFLAWCYAPPRNWLRTNPLDGLPRAKGGRQARRRLRRAYTIDEFNRLCAAAPEYRAQVYRIAAYSGLRRIELQRIQRCDCTPTGERPIWHLRPEVSKNGLAWKLPMLQECAEVLRPIWERAEPGKPLLWRMVPDIERLHDDLNAAGIARQDERGRHADFHGLRYTFCKVIGGKLPIQKVKVLMRHLTLQMTADLYGELEMEDVAEEVWSLPPLVEVAGPQLLDPTNSPTTPPE